MIDSINNGPAIIVGIVFSVAIAANCNRDIRRLVSARNVFLLTLAAWYILEATLVPDEITRYTQSQYNFGLLCVVLSGVAFLISYHTTKGGVFDPLFKRLATSNNNRFLFNLFMFAALVGFSPLLFIAKGNPLLILEDAFIPKVRWSSIFQRGRYGGVRDAFLELQMFLRAATPLAAAVAAQRQQSSSRRFVCGSFLIYRLARALNSGARSAVFDVALPVLAAIYWRLPPRMKRSAIFFGLPSLVGLTLIWSAASVMTRNTGEFSWSAASDAEYVGFEMFRELLYIQSNCDEYLWGYSYYVQMVNPIPRFIWPGKPEMDTGLMLAEMQVGKLSDGSISLTISPGLLGEMFWNFGLTGILLLSFIAGFLAKSWDRVLPLASQSMFAFCVFGAGLAVIFLSGRAFNMSILYGLLALYLLLLTQGKKANRDTGLRNGPLR